MTWRVSGAYVESCNCEAICPCRMVNGVPGGRSTYGVCYGAMAWRIDEGHAGDVDLSGLAVSLTISYDDDEPGSPWSIVLHIDERADEAQGDALEQIYLGELGGDVLRLPWIRKPRRLVSVRRSRIEIESGADGHAVNVGSGISLVATRPVEGDAVVACGIPGYHEPGTELYTDSFRVDDEPFAWELSGNCAFASGFSYTS